MDDDDDQDGGHGDLNPSTSPAVQFSMKELAEEPALRNTGTVVEADIRNAGSTLRWAIRSSCPIRLRTFSAHLC
jgi:hypothetical protein